MKWHNKSWTSRNAKAGDTHMLFPSDLNCFLSIVSKPDFTIVVSGYLELDLDNSGPDGFGE